MPQSELKLLASAHHAHVHHSSYFHSNRHHCLTLLVENITTFRDQCQAPVEYFKFSNLSILFSSQPNRFDLDLTAAIDEKIDRQRPPGDRKDRIDRPNCVG